LHINGLARVADLLDNRELTPAIGREEYRNTIFQRRRRMRSAGLRSCSFSAPVSSVGRRMIVMSRGLIVRNERDDNNNDGMTTPMLPFRPKLSDVDALMISEC
jgi:hypothetical protein